MSGLRNADPKPGERVAVLGVGGLGHLALQYAKARRARDHRHHRTGQQEGRADASWAPTRSWSPATTRARRSPTRAAPTSSCRPPTRPSRSAWRSAACAAAGAWSTWAFPTARITIDPMALTFGQRQLRGSSQDERADIQRRSATSRPARSSRPSSCTRSTRPTTCATDWPPGRCGIAPCCSTGCERRSPARGARTRGLTHPSRTRRKLARVTGHARAALDKHRWTSQQYTDW